MQVEQYISAQMPARLTAQLLPVKNLMDQLLLTQLKATIFVYYFTTAYDQDFINSGYDEVCKLLEILLI